MPSSFPPRPARVRVLIVDDSAFARKVMREALEADARIDVVAVARDGIDALEKITELKPDVIALDLVMPQLDGVGVLDALSVLPSPPRVVVVTSADPESALVAAALLSGAYAVVHKPTSLATDRLYELSGELVRKVLLAAQANTVPVGGALGTPTVEDDASGRVTPVVNAIGSRTSSSSSSLTTPQPTASQRLLTTTPAIKMLVMGASTGGPRAITQVLRALPATFPIPIALVVHMPAGYTEAFAGRLDRECPLEVVEAKDGTALRAGVVVVARAGIHMRVRKLLRLDGRPTSWNISLDIEPFDALHRPSVDALFESAASEVGAGVLGVVLTGMGSDGLIGARAIHGVGGHVIVEHESTCVVYGMPRAIADEGLAVATLPLSQIAAAVIARLY